MRHGARHPREDIGAIATEVSGGSACSPHSGRHYVSPKRAQTGCKERPYPAGLPTPTGRRIASAGHICGHPRRRTHWPDTRQAPSALLGPRDGQPLLGPGHRGLLAECRPRLPLARRSPIGSTLTPTTAFPGVSQPRQVFETYAVRMAQFGRQAAYSATGELQLAPGTTTAILPQLTPPRPFSRPAKSPRSGHSCSNGSPMGIQSVRQFRASMAASHRPPHTEGLTPRCERSFTLMAVATLTPGQAVGASSSRPRTAWSSCAAESPAPRPTTAWS